MAIEIEPALQARLQQHGITEFDEVALRQTLERYTTTYTLIKLAEWPARRWKCHYRLMMRESMYDAQTVSEAYAMGLLALLQAPVEKQDTH
ncbi:hypothetical protein [Dictyobacter kobayashii]|uniref:Uncharacterized protein n=1 Tax=Dictyobacter kobayashii TaxID=2014872 RepID=A0A402AIK4_9CHLR|nr:hypothetical protein [Dictyobacter kobayashii]GCE18893.1 hypothetical protein KDK_26930 [Dictyobacter kobayashii]